MKTPPAAALCLVLAMVSSPARANHDFDPQYASLGELRAALDSGRVTAEQLVKYYLGRIDRFDKAGPRINAMIRLNPEALEQARRLDAEDKKSLRRRSPLFGIP